MTRTYPAADSIAAQVEVATWRVLHLEEPPEVYDPSDAEPRLSAAYGTLPAIIQGALLGLLVNYDSASCDLTGSHVGHSVVDGPGRMIGRWEPCALVWTGTDPEDVFVVHADLSYDNLPDAAALNEGDSTRSETSP